MPLLLYGVGDFKIMIFATSQIPADIRPNILFISLLIRKNLSS